MRPTPAVFAASIAAVCCGTRRPTSLPETSSRTSAPSNAATSVDGSSKSATVVRTPRVDYSLTPLGRELVDHLLPLMRWVAEHADGIVAGRA